VDDFVEGGYTREERKLVHETRKILELPSLRLTATTVRVPVRVAHCEAVNVSLGRPVSAEEARRWFAEAPGVAVMDDPAHSAYPTPRQAAGRDEAFVGRIRVDESQPAGLDLWISCDNLRKGAALNAVQIAEEWSRRRAHEPSPREPHGGARDRGARDHASGRAVIASAIFAARRSHRARRPAASW
jgi:aspartate-semialdehyde dehydrogenase